MSPSRPIGDAASSNCEDSPFRAFRPEDGIAVAVDPKCAIGQRRCFRALDTMAPFLSGGSVPALTHHGLLPTGVIRRLPDAGVQCLCCNARHVLRR
jgi:hypothetical protein